MLRISAERLIEEETKDKAYLRHELRYGGFTRTLSLPKGASESDIKASCDNGILEIRVPVAKQLEESTRKKIAITKG
jgi:HSP20 family protein